ncbi:MAG: putative ATP synthase YscN [Chlamydiales bacterium]|nr:putative ATP synthase YscN [Chlamydiales bacterium]MCH9635039.1 putative ATP synthase YscN [Chlamydiales bacterium]
MIGLLIESIGPATSIGEICHIISKKGEKLPCQVVGFKESRVLLMPLGPVRSIAPGSEVFPTNQEHKVPVSFDLQGRVLDALSNPIDGKPPILPQSHYSVSAPPPAPFEREPIAKPLYTKIKAIDSLLTIGRGQRIGILSAPGVGKSSLMGMIARRSEADINVIALIGERGREVRDFVDNHLGPEGLRKSVVVVATSDQPALLRRKGANVAMAIAEYFRDQGKHVLLMMDSVSRYAYALREIGLAIGEPPTNRGYTPSVFADLPKLLERAGNNEKGSITGIYTILNEDEEWGDPIPEQMRSLLDGHIHLSRKLAEASHFPPIDVLKSLSRLMPKLVLPEQMTRANRLRELLHAYREAEELIQIGAYVSGSDPLVDEAIQKRARILQFLSEPGETSALEDVI